MGPEEGDTKDADWHVTCIDEKQGQSQQPGPLSFPVIHHNTLAGEEGAFVLSRAFLIVLMSVKHKACCIELSAVMLEWFLLGD